MPDEFAIPEELVAVTRAGRLVPFVGAGVSRNVLSPSGSPLFKTWSELVAAAASALELRMHVPPSIRASADYITACSRVRGKLLEGAQHAREVLGLPAWNRLLFDEFSQPVPADARGLELARSVWLVASDLVITTNYDNVLKVAAGGVATEMDSGSAERLAELCANRHSRKTIWYLHGTLARMNELILTLDSYKLLWPSMAEDRARAEVVFEAAQIALTQLLLTRTLLFVGSGVEDDILKKFIHLQRTFRGADIRHFALFRDQAGYSDFLDRVRSLGTTTHDLGLEPLIATPAGPSDSGSVERYLRQLHWDASPRKKTGPGHIARRYRRSHVIELREGETHTTLDVDYEHVGAIQATSGDGTTLEIPFTMDYVANPRDIGVTAQIEDIQPAVVAGAPAGVTARFVEPFDPRLHAERFAGTLVSEGLPATHPRSFKVAAWGRRFFATIHGTPDSSEWVSTGCYSQAEIQFSWVKPLGAADLVAEYSATGRESDLVRVDGVSAETPDTRTWQVTLDNVRIGARLKVCWNTAMSGLVAPAASHATPPGRTDLGVPTA